MTVSQIENYMAVLDLIKKRKYHTPLLKKSHDILMQVEKINSEFESMQRTKKEAP